MRCRMPYDDEDQEDDRKNRWVPPLEYPVKEKITRGELSGMMLAAILFVYAISEKDIPACFLTLSFLLWQLRVFANFLPSPWKIYVVKALQAFCFSLFIGAVLLLFL